MRLDVNPEQTEPMFMMESAHDHSEDGCMRGVSEQMGHRH